MSVDPAEKLIDGIIRREGGKANHAADRGGCTMYGITLPRFREWRDDETLTCADLFEIEEDEARAIYRADYIIRPGFDQIANYRLRELVVDCGVNHGTRRATRWLQKYVGAKIDGRFGPNTKAAANGQPPTKPFLGIIGHRTIFYGRLITRDHSQAVFAHGWARRVAEFLTHVPGCE